MWAGVVAALHIGKVPPALPALHQHLDLSLVEGGFLLSLTQLAGMWVGIFIGLAADHWGLRRSVLLGHGLLALASIGGLLSETATGLLSWRAVEGVGVLLVVLPAPSLIRQLVPAAQLAPRLGWWGAYMPTGTALALLLGPWILAQSSWQAWWGLLALLSIFMLIWVWHALPTPLSNATPAPPSAKSALAETPKHPPWQRLRETLTDAGVWGVAGCFAFYSSQWLAVIGFLPSVYAQAGVSGTVSGLLTACVCAANIMGNVAAGRLLHRGWTARRLLAIGFISMGVCAWLTFSSTTEGHPLLRFASVLCFSAVGGLLPGTLFSLAVRVAPSERTVATTVGWMQQCSSTGQFVGPPLVAWVAQHAHGWHLTWLVTASASLLGLILAMRLTRTSHDKH
jgi:MFS transporter, CP family, cyanate transporter